MDLTVNQGLAALKYVGTAPSLSEIFLDCGFQPMTYASIRANGQFAEAEQQSSRVIKRLRRQVIFANHLNLNGARLTEGEWLRHLEDERSLTIGVAQEFQLELDEEASEWLTSHSLIVDLVESKRRHG